MKGRASLRERLEVFAKFRQRQRRVRVEGNRHFNPGWHLALSLHSMLTMAEAVTRSAIERKESRGGHTRDDYPTTDPAYGKVNVVTRLRQGEMVIAQEPLPEMPDDFKQLLAEGS